MTIHRRESGPARADVGDRLIVALDVSAAAEAEGIVSLLASAVRWYKVGLQLFCAEGPAVVRRLRRLEKRIFLDLKLHDIPNTMARAVEAAGGLGADLLSVHARAGRRALEEAAAAAARLPRVIRPRLLGVTVLTSEGDLSEAQLVPEVLRLAECSLAAGLDGVVAPAMALEALHERLGREIAVLCAGIRPAGTALQDQRFTMTPAEAVSCGARWIVVGRPVLRSPDPAAAVAAIREEMQAALAGQRRPL